MDQHTLDINHLILKCSKYNSITVILKALGIQFLFLKYIMYKATAEYRGQRAQNQGFSFSLSFNWPRHWAGLDFIFFPVKEMT